MDVCLFILLITSTGGMRLHVGLHCIPRNCHISGCVSVHHEPCWGSNSYHAKWTRTRKI